MADAKCADRFSWCLNLPDQFHLITVDRLLLLGPALDNDTMAQRRTATNEVASVATAAAPQYIYHQQAPSTVENVLATILHPGVNKATYNVLNVTLAVLFVVISLMLWAFDGIASRFRFHLWIFLVVCFALILSVNWFFSRYQLYGHDDSDEEEEEESAETKPAAKKPAAAIADQHKKQNASTTVAETKSSPKKKASSKKKSKRSAKAE